jgi:hypothetical protein
MWCGERASGCLLISCTRQRSLKGENGVLSTQQIREELADPKVYKRDFVTAAYLLGAVGRRNFVFNCLVYSLPKLSLFARIYKHEYSSKYSQKPDTSLYSAPTEYAPYITKLFP